MLIEREDMGVEREGRREQLDITDSGGLFGSDQRDRTLDKEIGSDD